MTKLNVVEMGAFKELRDIKKSLGSFEKYLKGLSNIQLEVEVNHLIKNSQEGSFCQDIFSRSQLILKEISGRVHPVVKPKIEALREH
jgi:hypothetical protein